MKKNFILPFLFVSFIGLTQTMHKQVDALRTVSEPKIDGYLEEFALTKLEADDLIIKARDIAFK